MKKDYKKILEMILEAKDPEDIQPIREEIEEALKVGMRYPALRGIYIQQSDANLLTELVDKVEKVILPWGGV